MQQVTDYLRVDHERLHALLAQAAAGPELDAGAFEQFRAGLLRHIAIEEKLLLTAARRARGGEPIERARALRIEHGALASLLVPTPDLALCTEIAALVNTHDAVEEGPSGVYAECEALIGEALSQTLLASAREFAQVPVAQHFDGEGTVRTAELALASARRMAAPRAARQLSTTERELDKLQAEHASFGKLLDLLQAQLAVFHRAEQPDYELMRDIFDYLTRYPDRFHHPKEDRIFEKLAQRDPSTRANVGVLAKQHQVIAHSGARFLQKLEAALAGAILPRQAVEAPAQDYIAFYRAHMKLEESQLFPIARLQLRESDWLELDATPTEAVDPLLGSKLQARYRAIQRRISMAAECGCAVN